ncbi:hypothetical protein [Paenibacillus medicaginis]|uniref:Uncharacterized protein n=1 Tax=Paenibacillus medicaginis TaxID=1470560 RepID=A0ABV5C200_9BACL
MNVWLRSCFFHYTVCSIFFRAMFGMLSWASGKGNVVYGMEIEDFSSDNLQFYSSLINTLYIDLIYEYYVFNRTLGYGGEQFDACHNYLYIFRN